MTRAAHIDASRVARVLIVGISGSGKTRLARRLGDALHLPVVHLDSIFWCDGWTERDPIEVTDLVRAALERDRWIIEGYIEPLGQERVQRADVVIYLDVSGRVAAMGVLRRWLKHRRTARPELPATNREPLDREFLRMVARRGERPEIEAIVRDARHVIRVTSRRAARRIDAASGQVSGSPRRQSAK